MAKVKQLEARLPLQDTLVQVPYENTLGGFEMFNVGITDRDELKGFIERQRAKGIYLSVLGFGMGNYNDALMQTLAQNGNGVAAYIDTIVQQTAAKPISR